MHVSVLYSSGFKTLKIEIAENRNFVEVDFSFLSGLCKNRGLTLEPIIIFGFSFTKACSLLLYLSTHIVSATPHTCHLVKLIKTFSQSESYYAIGHLFHHLVFIHIYTFTYHHSENHVHACTITFKSPSTQVRIL